MMPLSPTITLAAIPTHTPARALGTVPTAWTPSRRVVFILQNVQGDKKRCFYECSFDGCGGCGCPSFEISETLEVPTWVLDHLRIHVQLYHSGVAGRD